MSWYGFSDAIVYSIYAGENTIVDITVYSFWEIGFQLLQLEREKKMSKRQRSDREVVTACDLADAIEEVQNLVPEFTIENILNKTRVINRMLREIP